MPLTCAICDWSFDEDPANTKKWQRHVSTAHSTEPLNMLTQNLPNTWKHQVRCACCRHIFSDHAAALKGHAKACTNQFAMKSNRYNTYKELFPDTEYVSSWINDTIRSPHELAQIQADRNSNPFDSLSETSDLENCQDASAPDSTIRQQPASTECDSPDNSNMETDETNSPDTSPTATRFSERIAIANSKPVYREYDDDEEEEDEEEEEEDEPGSPFRNRNRNRNQNRIPNLTVTTPDLCNERRANNMTGNKTNGTRNKSRRTRFLTLDQNVTRSTQPLADLSYRNAPTAQQTELLTGLITDFSDGAFTTPSGHIKDFQAINDKLLLSTTHTLDACTRELSVAAWLLLPGLYTRLQRKRVPKLNELMRGWTNHETPHLQIIQHAQKTQLRFPSRANTNTTSKLTSERATELIKAGRIGALMRALEQEQGPGVIRKSSAEMSDLATPLHPPATETDDDFTDITAPDIAPITFNIHELAQCITKVPEVSAPGASGWTNALLKKLYGKEAYSISNKPATASTVNPSNDPLANAGNSNPEKGIALLHRFYCMFLNKELNQRTYDRLLMSRLILIPKPNGGTRPIAIGDTTLRLMLRVINAKVARDVGKKLEPLQVAVGTPGGCEIIAALVQFTLEQGRDSADTDTHRSTCTIDLPNAFNGVNRRSIANGLKEYCPELLDLFTITYGNRSELRAHTADGRGHLIGHSEKGCRQGDPLSMLYFAVAIHPALIKIQETLDTAHAHANLDYKPRVVAYADDIAINGNSQITLDNFATIDTHLTEATGLSSNIRKSALLGQGVKELTLPSSLEPIALNEDGGTIVGIPVGTAAIRESLAQEIIDSHAKSIKLVVQNKVTGEQAKFSLLKFCANTKVDYICRNVNPHIIHKHVEAFDAQMDDGLSSITDEVLDTTAKSLRGLPIKLAGLGLRRHAGMQSFNDYNSRTLLVSDFARPHLPELADALDAVGSLPLSPLPEHADLTVAAINKLHLQEVCARVIDGSEHGARLNAHIRSGCLDEDNELYSTSGLFTNYMGGSDQRKTMHDDTFVTALRNRLCMPICNLDLNCTNTDIHAARNQPAHVNIRTSFMHTVLCQPAKGVSQSLKRRHDFVRDALKDLIRDTAFSGLAAPPKEALGMEVKVGTQQNGNDIVADLVWHDGLNTARSHRHIFDVTIVEACGKDGNGQDNGQAAALAAAKKLARYAEVGEAEHTTFIPFAMESAGHIGHHATTFLSQLAARAPGNATRIAQFLSFTSFVITKYTADASVAGRRSAVMLSPVL